MAKKETNQNAQVTKSRPRQCMKAIKPELAKDSECLAALSAKSGKGGKDKESEATVPISKPNYVCTNKKCFGIF